MSHSHLDSAAFPGKVAASPLHWPAEESTVTGALVDIEGQRFYRIEHVEQMAPFLTTVASDGDHWMFVSSTGGLTAGRRDPDQALFSYTTDDRLHDSAAHTGPITIVRVRDGEADCLWQPFSSRYEGLYRISRSLAKSVVGNQLRFEEINHSLGLGFSYTWAPSESFGFVRRCQLANLREAEREVALVDGLQDLLPAGLGRRFQMELSTLGDGYKDSEIDPASGLGLYRLSSIPVDAPEPCEALRATTVWSHGLPAPRFALSPAALDAFRRGHAWPSETRLRGRRGGYFANARFTLAPAAIQRFALCANVEQDHSAIVELQHHIAGPTPMVAVSADVTRGTRELVQIVAAADGLQAGGDPLASARHFSSVMFNCMRGGIPVAGYEVSKDDFIRFVRTSNRRVFARHQPFWEQLPARAPHAVLLTAARASGDADLERIAHEYLPFTFGRRHGDPSRPWNVFSITVRDSDGKPTLDYQGNWRDIFQNWEALGRSFPGFTVSMIFKFLNASTADGHNPYRVSREGFDWEVHDPHDPWSHIGYWGDHQIIYLLKLMELLADHDPEVLPGLLGRQVFSYANVPYQIKPYHALLRDPHHTIDFDAEAHRAALARVKTMGSDGRLLQGARGEVIKVALVEKLLVMVLAKLANFVPDVGIWMNTQRPEWNDANNALVGHGASMVTVYHLRRFLAFVRTLCAPAAATTFAISAEVATWLGQTLEALQRFAEAGAPSEKARRGFLDAVAEPFSDYRAGLYARGLGGRTAAISGGLVQKLCEVALGHLDRAIAANRRADGLYHAYNLLELGEDGIGVRRLDVMLEGQVAVLSSGHLRPAQALEVLTALRASALYRADAGSYLLYPDRELPRFLEKNRLDAADVAGAPLIGRLLEARHRGIVARDENGDVHFHAACKNARALATALTELGAAAPALAGSPAEREQVLAIYEKVFDHHAFTGRSGTLYKYEGLGCIYWHMVSKLRLAAHENLRQACHDGSDAAVIAGLRARHAEIVAGLGLQQSPADYGAFTTDPYSHTPSFAGVQQPGMTGQVKEDILARLGELGVVVQEGQLGFVPALVSPDEFATQAGVLASLGLEGRASALAFAAGGYGLHVCQVPVLVHRDGPPSITITKSDGTVQVVPGLCLDAHASRALFGRTGLIARIDVHFGVTRVGVA